MNFHNNTFIKKIKNKEIVDYPKSKQVSRPYLAVLRYVLTVKLFTCVR